jgi:hypothetical protein
VCVLKNPQEAYCEHNDTLYRVNKVTSSEDFKNYEAASLLTVFNIKKASDNLQAMFRLVNEIKGNSHNGSVVIGPIFMGWTSVIPTWRKLFSSENAPVKWFLQGLLDDKFVCAHVSIQATTQLESESAGVESVT